MRLSRLITLSAVFQENRRVFCSAIVTPYLAPWSAHARMSSAIHFSTSSRFAPFETDSHVSARSGVGEHPHHRRAQLRRDLHQALMRATSFARAARSTTVKLLPTPVPLMARPSSKRAAFQFEDELVRRTPCRFSRSRGN